MMKSITLMILLIASLTSTLHARKRVLAECFFNESPIESIEVTSIKKRRRPVRYEVKVKASHYRRRRGLVFHATLEHTRHARGIKVSYQNEYGNWIDLVIPERKGRFSDGLTSATYPREGKIYSFAKLLQVGGCR